MRCHNAADLGPPPKKPRHLYCKTGARLRTHWGWTPKIRGPFVRELQNVGALNTVRFLHCLIPSFGREVTEILCTSEQAPTSPTKDLHGISHKKVPWSFIPAADLTHGSFQTSRPPNKDSTSQDPSCKDPGIGSRPTSTARPHWGLLKVF